MNVRQNIDVDLRATMEALGTKARAAAEALRTCPASTRTAAIKAMARQLRARTADVLRANDIDIAAASGKTDRLKLDEARVAGIVEALEQVADLPDPVGAERARWQRPNGLDIARVSTPIGVIGMIYESRPNVTADAAAICVRSGNAIILRSGSEALRSALAIGDAIAAALAEAGLPKAGVQVVPTVERDAVGMMIE